MMVVLAAAAAALQAAPPDMGPELSPAPLEKDQKGLLPLVVKMPPSGAASADEMEMGIRPYPGVQTERLCWVSVPASYDPSVPAPVLFALHPRGRLPVVSSSICLKKPGFLDRWCKATLETWRGLSEQKGFIVVTPLGDPDPLTMGLSWHWMDRSAMFDAILEEIRKSHAIDPKRVYAAGSGDGAHMLLSTAAKKPGLFAAIACCNPPLFEGEQRIQDPNGPLLLPPTIDAWAKEGGMKVPALVLAGDKGKRPFLSGRAKREMGGGDMPQPPRFDDNGQPIVDPAPPERKEQGLRRYVDHESYLLIDHMERMTQKLKASEPRVELWRLDGAHAAALPAGKAAEVWAWLSAFPPSEKPPAEK